MQRTVQRRSDSSAKAFPGETRPTLNLVCPAFLLGMILALATAPTTANAQLIQTQVPAQNIGNSYYEGFALGWGIQGPGFFGNFNGIQAPPPFGGFDPNAGATTGVGFRRGGWSGNLGLSLNQGSSRSNTSTTASVTTTDGLPGNITNQTYTPYVTGIVPIVGGRPAGFIQPIPPVTSSGQQDLAYQQNLRQAEVQQRLAKQHDARQQKAYASLQRGIEAEEKGNLRMARANYRNALQAAEGEIRVEVVRRMQAHGWIGNGR
ncbi:hypothetical protein [Neorhodopirellula lusitana]|uniref:hypothetical protein n=1 Tax=Neorhodopirellula lusitana TaxID=445327 RepID=UPI00384CDBDA